MGAKLTYKGLLTFAIPNSCILLTFLYKEFASAEYFFFVLVLLKGTKHTQIRVSGRGITEFHVISIFLCNEDAAYNINSISLLSIAVLSMINKQDFLYLNKNYNFIVKKFFKYCQLKNYLISEIAVITLTCFLYICPSRLNS